MGFSVEQPEVGPDHLRFNCPSYTPPMRLLLAGSLLALLTCPVLGINQNAPVLPDPRLSPGDVLTSDPKIICVSGYTQTVRNVPQSLKEQVYKTYGITRREPGEYEIDHIISLELGGSNSIRNLYPESYKTQPLNAHVKDKLENRLHALACSGKITFQEAQKAIASNWTAAYLKYLGPLPGGAQPVGVRKTSPPPPQVPALPPARVTSAPPLSDGSCPASAAIKGNIGAERIYHLPDDWYYTRTRAEACFSNAAAAQAAGYRASR